MAEDEGNGYVDTSNYTSDVMWMKMALMAASRAEVTQYAKGKPSIGCVIRRSRDRGAPAVLAVGWNGFLPGFVLFCFMFYKLFRTQACPEGIGTNGTHRSHARCHPYPIPQPVKVGHTTGVYFPYSFRTVVWVLLRPTRTDQ